MKSFPKEFEYRGYLIRRTSFNWVCKSKTGDFRPEIVETIEDGKKFIDAFIKEKEEKERDRRVVPREKHWLEDEFGL